MSTYLPDVVWMSGELSERCYTKKGVTFDPEFLIFDKDKNIMKMMEIFTNFYYTDGSDARC